MGKTWKRRDAVGKRHGRKRESGNGCGETDIGPDCPPEEAFKRLEMRFASWFDIQCATGLLLESDREDCWQIIFKQVADNLGRYDPERTGTDGRKASFLTYLRVVFESAATKIVRAARRRKEAFPLTMHIVDVPVAVARTMELSISSEDARLGDRCRSVNELVYRMDVAAFMAMLTPEERTALRLRDEGVGEEGCAEAIGCSRMTFRNRCLPSIQRKARICGFLSQEDLRFGRDERYYCGKSKKV